MIDDISFQNNDQLVKIRIRISKTSNKGSPIELIIPCETDAKFCPIRSLRHYVNCRPTYAGYLRIPAQKVIIASILLKAIRTAKLDDLHFRSHSLRIGRATQLANEGVSLDVIQRLGRWKSNAFYHIWMIGDSILYLAGRRAMDRNMANLKLPGNVIGWNGVRGIKWTAVHHIIQRETLFSDIQPKAILLHLGGNDLDTVSLYKLRRIIKHEISHLYSVFTDTTIIWCDILQRQAWRGVG
ncbi:hypothetical protein MAR_021220, partial [Mya arenaria]